MNTHPRTEEAYERANRWIESTRNERLRDAAERDELDKECRSVEEDLSRLRESVRRLVDALEDIGSQEPNEDHNDNLNDMIACQSVEKANEALTAFLAENKELTPPQTEGRGS